MLTQLETLRKVFRCISGESTDGHSRLIDPRMSPAANSHYSHDGLFYDFQRRHPDWFKDWKDIKSKTTSCFFLTVNLDAVVIKVFSLNSSVRWFHPTTELSSKWEYENHIPILIPNRRSIHLPLMSSYLQNS